MSRATNDIKGIASNKLKTDLGLALVALVALVVVLVSVFGDWQPAQATSTGTIIGTLVRKDSDVRRRSLGSLVWQQAEAGTAIFERDALYVADASDAQVLLADGSRVDIDPNSLVVLSLAQAQKPEANVLRGGALGTVGAGALTLRAGDVLAELSHNTRGRLLRAGDTARFAVNEGTGLLRVKGDEHVVPAGQRQNVSPTHREVEALGPTLLSPKPSERLIVQQAQSVAFRWQHQGSGPITFELSRQSSFATAALLSSQSVDGTMQVPSLEPGVYYWRVRGGEGAQAFVSEERKLVVLLDAPPSITAPSFGAIVDLSGSIPAAIAFTPSAEAESYTVELALEGAAPKLFPTLRPILFLFREAIGAREGTYCARVRAERSQGSGTFGQSVCFRVVLAPILKAPELYEPKQEKLVPKKQGFRFDPWLLLGGVAHAQAAEEALTLRWERILGATQYVVEIATDANFSHITLQQRAPQNYHVFVPKTAELFFWRVRAVDAQGREGELSAPRQLDLRPALKPTEEPKHLRKQAPPQLVSPVDGTKLERARGESIVLRWQSKGAKSFEVQVSGSDSFNNAQKHTTDTPEIALPLEDGPFHWRVRVTNPRGVFSLTGQFSVKTATPPVRVGSRRTIKVGPLVAFFSDGSKVRTWRVGGDLELQGSGALARLRLVTRLTYYTTNQGRAGFAGANARLHSLPFDVTAGLAFEPGALTLLFGAGAILAPFVETGEAGGVGLNVGAQLSAAAWFDVGGGALATSLSLAVATNHAERVASSPGGLMLTLGYRFAVPTHGSTTGSL